MFRLCTKLKSNSEWQLSCGRGLGVGNLSSYIGADGPIQKNAAESLPDIGALVAAERMAGATFAEADRWGGAETILLVEDQEFVRKVTAETLELAGYRLVIAGSAAEALARYPGGGESVDLLLADVVMPGMSGRELAAEFEGLYPRTRVLLMSGYAEQLTMCELSLYRATYLAKPFSGQALLKKVRAVLDPSLCDLGAPA